MASFLFLGFLIGIRHALEADHVAAVVSLATRGGSFRRQVGQGAMWGLGHTLTLLVVVGACVSLGLAIPDSASRWFEAIVGAMLVILGASVFLRLRAQRIHVHVHRHADGIAHFHAHRHDEVPSHEHAHACLPLRALVVGSVHGLAGSAALVLLMAQTVQSPATGFLYIALFGLGSVVGMMSIAAAIAVPLRATVKDRARLHELLCAGAGAFSVLLGTKMIWMFAA
ncbi:MAG TPA: sulfite exporter TauE/SafE family protein [Planctomycetota bacterium]|nr:sulfite exporter TauE/SafE family protein [Planctomycetota bacterium]